MGEEPLQPEQAYLISVFFFPREGLVIREEHQLSDGWSVGASGWLARSVRWVGTGRPQWSVESVGRYGRSALSVGTVVRAEVGSGRVGRAWLLFFPKSKDFRQTETMGPWGIKNESAK